MPRKPDRRAPRARRSQSKPRRLPLGRLRDLVAALRSYGRVFAAMQVGSDVRLAQAPEGATVRLASGVPTSAPQEPVLPPADAFFGLRSRPLNPADLKGERGPVVLFGVPPCVVYSIRFLDGLLASGPFRDAAYSARRSKCLVVAMNCRTQARGCYCGDLGVGPALRSSRHADVVLTPAGSGFFVESGSATGAKILNRLEVGARSRKR